MLQLQEVRGGHQGGAAGVRDDEARGAEAQLELDADWSPLLLLLLDALPLPLWLLQVPGDVGVSR